MAPALRRGRLLSSIAAAVAVAIVLLGLAGALHSARATEAPLLPRLEAETPDGAYLETNANEIKGEHVNRLLLKFNGYIHNGGRGAVDVRGARTAPATSEATKQKVKRDEEKSEETLGSTELEELATPKMGVIQREFAPVKKSSEELEVDREPAAERPLTEAELFYSASDGHDHWHLQHVAKYVLENKAGEVKSPGQKVGFCLDDSLHRDESKGPPTPAYSDGVPPFRHFCEQYKPETKTVYEGISPGWSDLYGSYLAWQWVDVSNVLPGEYVIAEEVDPEHGPGLQEESGGKKTSTSLAVIVPGYDAEAPPPAATEFGQAKAIPLKSKAWLAPKSERENPETHKLLPETGSVEYVVSHQPQHGHVTISGTTATYTPEGGFSGTDGFTYVAKDKSSPEFPNKPVEAAATITVGAAPPNPEVTIESSPSGLTTATTAPLEARESDDGSGIEWTTTGGSIKAEGNGEKAVLTAPSTPETITVTATLKDKKASKSIAIPITAPAPAEPAPSVPVEIPQTGGSGGVAGNTASHGLSHPRAMLFGRRLVITTTPYAAGRLKVEALVGKRVLGSCGAVTPARRQFTCHIKLPSKFSLKAHISIVASLKEADNKTSTIRLSARVIPQMKMVMASSIGGAAALRITGFWCSPSMLVPTLAYESDSVSPRAVPSRPRRLAQ